MWMQQRLSLKLTQKPILTQSLRQLVKLLALNKLDLKAEINQELSENPVLEAGSEITEDTEAEDGAEEPRNANGPEASSALPAGEGSAAPDSESGPEPEADPFSEIDLVAFFGDYLDSGPRAPMGEISERPSFETFLAKPTTLTDHLMWQLSMSHTDDGVGEAAEAVIGNLNEDGYLTAEPEELVRFCGCTPEVVDEALQLVQHFDPVGVAACDLRECLLIQLRACDAEDGVAGRIVRYYQLELEIGDLEKIALEMDRPLRHIEVAVALIKHLDPRPGQRYNATSARIVEPDVQFIRTSDGFRVVLNEEDLPELRLNRKYRQLLGRGKADKEVRDYVRERYNSAIQLIRNIEQRRQTIRRVCEAVVRRQTPFLSQGLDHLRPMMIKDVAEEIGVHPSTVSRAVANKYAHTPHGVYELRFFFSEAVQGPAGASIPLMLLKRKVKKMIEQEDAAHPLTDDHISKILKENGISVTRRTIAKYREDMNIPSTHRRRRKALLSRKGPVHESSLHGTQGGNH